MKDIGLLQVNTLKFVFLILHGRFLCQCAATAVLQELGKCCRKENPSAVMTVYSVQRERLAMLQVPILFILHDYNVTCVLTKCIFYLQIPLTVFRVLRTSGQMHKETLVSQNLLSICPSTRSWESSWLHFQLLVPAWPL